MLRDDMLNFVKRKDYKFRVEKTEHVNSKNTLEYFIKLNKTEFSYGTNIDDRDSDFLDFVILRQN